MTNKSDFSAATPRPCPFCGCLPITKKTADEDVYLLCPTFGCITLDRYFSSSDTAIAAWNTRASDAEIAAPKDEWDRLREARNLAYGLLWGMSIDLRNRSDDLAYRARQALLAHMTKDDQRAGIEAARAALNQGKETGE